MVFVACIDALLNFHGPWVAHFFPNLEGQPGVRQRLPGGSTRVGLHARHMTRPAGNVPDTERADDFIGAEASAGSKRQGSPDVLLALIVVTSVRRRKAGVIHGHRAESDFRVY
jgi:hypothetical protein